MLQPEMHLLALAKHWQTYELIFRNGKKKDLRDLFACLALEIFSRGGVIFILKHSGKRVNLRPQRDEDKWLAQKLRIRADGRGEWHTVGQFMKFNETRTQELKQEEMCRRLGLG